MGTKSLSRLIIGLLLLITSLLVGLIGFTLIEGFDLIDAFYMTVITFSTVGFNEVHPLTSEGRLFTGFYIIMNLGIFAYVVSVVTTYFFEGELKSIFKQLRRGKEVKKIKKHVIVVGYGRNGRKACEELENSGVNFVIIESDKSRIENMPEAHSLVTIEGDATHDNVMKEARIEEASAIISTLPKDANNVFISLTARELNPDIFIIARASEEFSESKLRRAGADKVVMPDALGGIHMAHLITKPYVNEFIELFTGMGNTQLHLEEYSFEQFRPEFRDQTIMELDVRKKTGVTVVGFKDDNRGFQFNPGLKTAISANDIVIILGRKEEIAAFTETYIR